VHESFKTRIFRYIKLNLQEYCEIRVIIDRKVSLGLNKIIPFQQTIPIDQLEISF